MKPRRPKNRQQKRKSPRRPTGKEYRDWREAVLKRDEYSCQKCGKKPRKLVIHHILSYAKYPTRRYDVDNGAALCRKCHKTFHRIYGVHKFTDLDYYEFLKGSSRRDKSPDG